MTPLQKGSSRRPRRRFAVRIRAGLAGRRFEQFFQWSQTIQFKLTSEQLSFVDETGTWLLEPGDFKVWVGGQQPDLKASRQPANVLEGQFTVA